MSTRLHIILVEKPYLEEFKGLCRKYNDFITLQYFEREKIKDNAYFTPFEIRMDGMGKRLSSIINGSVKFDTDWSYYGELLPRVIKHKTIYSFLNDYRDDLEILSIFTNGAVDKAYEKVVGTLRMLYEHPNCEVILSI